MRRIAVYSNDIAPSPVGPGEPTNEGERYRRLLSPVMPGVEFTMFDVPANEFPADLSNFDGAIIGGSTAMVSDDLPWIANLADEIRRLADRKVKIWGTCFGHQMLGKVFGAEIGARSPTFGAPHIEVLANEAWMHPYMPSLRVLAGNFQQILKLGPNMRRLAMARGNANAMVAVGKDIVGFQFHPESSPQAMEHFLDNSLRERAIDIHTHQEAKAEIHGPTNHDVIAKWMARFFAD